MNTTTTAQTSPPDSYTNGSHQSAQGWIVLAAIALAAIAYKRGQGRQKNTAQKEHKRLFLSVRRKEKKEAIPPKPKNLPTIAAPASLPAGLPADLVPHAMTSFDATSASVSSVAGPAVVSGVPGQLMRRLQKDAWTKMCSARQMSGLMWTGVEESPFGVRVGVEFEGMMNFSKAQAAVSQIEAGLDVVPGSVVPKIGVTAGRGWVEIRTKEPFPDGVGWVALPTGRTRLAEPVHVATDPDGEKIYISAKQRILITGTSGAGKSSLQRVLGAHVIQSEDANLEFWDFKRTEAAPYEGKARCVTTVREVIERIEWLMDEEYVRRADLMVSEKATEWVESP